MVHGLARLTSSQVHNGCRHSWISFCAIQIEAATPNIVLRNEQKAAQARTWDTLLTRGTLSDQRCKPTELLSILQCTFRCGIQRNECDEQMMRLFVLHCFDSNLSASKARPEGFSREALWKTVCATTEGVANLQVIPVLDTANRKGRSHMCDSHPNVCTIHGGSGSKAFAALLSLWQERATLQQWSESDIVVLLEDDYAVKGPWIDAVRNGLRFGEYVTLYDHPDKYSSLYDGTPSQVFAGTVCHWRTTPSTTNSFATTWKTLRQDLDSHAQFSTPDVPAVRDHAKWLHLWSRQRILVSSLPGFWSHEEVGMQSPMFHSSHSSLKYSSSSSSSLA